MNERFRRLWAEPERVALELIDVVAPWVVDASRPFADWYFGEPEVAAEIVREWMSRPTSELYVGRSIIVEDDDGQLSGCLIGLSGAELTRCRAADFAAFCEELGSEPEANEVIEEVLTASHELFPPVAEDELYISRVGVDPSRRGQGLGTALVRHAVENPRSRDLRACRLDVSAANRTAIRAYETAGLRTLITSHSPTAGLTYVAMGAEM